VNIAQEALSQAPDPGPVAVQEALSQAPDLVRVEEGVELGSRMVIPAETHLRHIVASAGISHFVAPSSGGVQAVTVLPQTMPLGGQSEAAGPPFTFMLGQGGPMGPCPANPLLPFRSRARSRKTPAGGGKRGMASPYFVQGVAVNRSPFHPLR